MRAARFGPFAAAEWRGRKAGESGQALAEPCRNLVVNLFLIVGSFQTPNMAEPIRISA